MPREGAGIPFDRLGDLSEQLRSREGQEAVYRETGFVAVVRVHGLGYDHEGVFGTATVVRPLGADLAPPTGPAPCGRDSWRFGAGWGYYSLSPLRWSATYGGGWALYFDAELARDLVSLGLDGYETIRGIGKRPDRDRVLKRFERFSGRVREYEIEMARRNRDALNS